MKIFSCRKCSSAELFIKEGGTQCGLYCTDCGAWQKWLNKDEKRLAENWIEEMKSMKETSAQQNPVDIKFDELRIAAQPLLEFLNKYYNPHCYAVVTEGRVDIFSGEMGIPLPVRD